MSPLEPRPAASFEFQEILYEKRDARATITINRPKSYNAYTTGTLTELVAAFTDASLDDRVAVVVLTGAGDRAFCTGGDVKEYEETYLRRPHDYFKYMAIFRAYLESILNCGKPVIARLNGMAVGGGNESQLACDLTVAADHAFMKQVGVHVGSVAAGGATQWLPLAVGDKRARAMLMLGEPVSARQAVEWGLVNERIPSVTGNGTLLPDATPDQIESARRRRDGFALDLAPLDRRIDALCERLIDTFPECLRYTKRQASFLKEFTWHQTIGHAQDWLSIHFACREPLEGMRAFVEKRPPRYRELRAEAAEGGSPEFPWGAYSAACPKCGATALPSGFSFCGSCGARVEA
ncbi:MAG: enoyl-CoA hydratase/isomerase family protein [Acidobacteria bacterium]|nr:enoyl-CoA hydratase/isomerase family protein [Acidobacteriota bacterium]